MQFFFQELYSHIDKSSGGGGRKFTDMFLLKIANKGTSLKECKSKKCFTFVYQFHS